MFDVTASITYKNIPNFYRDLTIACGEIPMVICGNKVDVPHAFQTNQITFPRKKGLPYCDISLMTVVNFFEPFLFLACKMVADESLTFFGPLVSFQFQIPLEDAVIGDNEDL